MWKSLNQGIHIFEHTFHFKTNESQKNRWRALDEVERYPAAFGVLKARQGSCATERNKRHWIDSSNGLRAHFVAFFFCNFE